MENNKIISKTICKLIIVLSSLPENHMKRPLIKKLAECINDLESIEGYKP